MRKGIVSAIGILAVAVIGYSLYFQWAVSKSNQLSSGHGNQSGLVWLKMEFGLNDAEFEALKKANEGFMPRCEAMCLELVKARQRLASLIDNDAEIGELEATYARIKEIEQRCYRMTLAHIHEVSQLMKPEEGTRYRKKMISELSSVSLDHHCLHDAPSGAGK